MTAGSHPFGPMQLPLQAELLRRYPRTFRLPSADGLESGRFGGFNERGVACGDGWFSLIDKMATATEMEIEVLRRAGVDKSEWPRVVHIKEKRNTLRFRLAGLRFGALRECLVNVSEVESRCVCEHCGNARSVRDDDRSTYCKACADIHVDLSAGANLPTLADYAVHLARLREFLARGSP